MASSLSQPPMQPVKPAPKTPKPAKPGGGGFSLGGSGSSSTFSYTLSDVDALLGPETFAYQAGYANLDEFVSDNEAVLTLVEPESLSDWPPQSAFEYWIAKSGDTERFFPTGRVDPNYRLPTFTSPSRSGEWLFPVWNTALTHADSGIIEGKEPISATGRSIPVVLSLSDGRQLAVIPWTAGTVVQVRNEPVYL